MNIGEEIVICLDCGWEGYESETDYHYAKPHLFSADYTTCPECGSERLMEKDAYDKAQADGHKAQVIKESIEILADRVLGGEDWNEIVKELENQVAVTIRGVVEGQAEMQNKE